MTTPDQIWASGDGKNGSWTSKPSPEEWDLPQSGYIRRDPAVLAALPEVRDLLRRAYAAGWDAYHAQQQADWTDTRGVEVTREADLDAIAPAPDLAAMPEVRALVDAETERCAKIADRAVDVFGRAMRETKIKSEKRDWQSMLFAAVDIAAAIREGRT